MARPILVVAAVLGSYACGGKILVEESDAAPSANEGVVVAGGGALDASAAGPAPVSVADACATICERQGRCGSRTDACEARCEQRAAAGCGASEWLLCYAARIEGCGMLPPACEPAYCAWAACAGEPVPDYCG